MKPRKLPLAAAVISGIAAMLAAYFVFHIDRHTGRLGFAVLLLVLVLFTRPWHKSGGNDDDEN